MGLAPLEIEQSQLLDTDVRGRFGLLGPPACDFLGISLVAFGGSMFPQVHPLLVNFDVSLSAGFAVE